MLNKGELLFAIIQTTGLLYEVRHQGPNVLGDAMNNINEYLETQWQVIDEIDFTASEMAKQYLEFIYNGAPMPSWWIRT